jgi:hypothetical protein
MRYREFNERQRLTGQLSQRGSQAGLSAGGAAFFGLPFVGAGVAIILIGLKVIQVDPGSVHAPYWVLTVCGVCFLGAGLMLWGMAVRQYQGNRRRAAINGGTPAGVALADYNWNRSGCQASRWKNLFKTGFTAAGVSVFLSIFNWWAFGAQEPLMVKIIVGLFDLVLLILWWQFLLTLVRALKFSGSRIAFARFPYSVNEPVLIRWQTPGGINGPRKGSFTLRCVEEWWETTGSGKNRSNRLVQEEIWSGAWQLEPADELLPGKTRDFSFQPPADAPPTGLSSRKPVFWEFEVKLEMPGPDFVANYLVPVYAG